MTDPRIEAARGMLHVGVSYSSEHPDFQDIVLAARALPFALNLAEAVDAFEAADGHWDDSDSIRTCGICTEVGEHWEKCPIPFLEAFLAVLPDA